MQRFLFETKEQKEEFFDYENNDAEAVCYVFTDKGTHVGSFFVMLRYDAVKFCESNNSRGIRNGTNWAFAFTTHRRNWRYELETFRKDDGRYDSLFERLNIKLIYVKK